jgi:predicted nucleic acid-binding protein
MLLDSNIIYAAQPVHAELRRSIAENDVVVSAVSLVEVLGYHKLTAPDRATLSAFFAASEILPITGGVLERAVQLRQPRKMSLGDALVTRNVNDFGWIEGLNLHSPFPN